MAVASVTYKADIKDLKAKLESVTDITRAEARKMVTELNRSYRKMESSNKSASSMMIRSQQKAIESTKSLSGGLKGISDQSGEIDSIMSGLGGSLGMLDPRLEKLTQGASEAASGIEAVAKAGVLSVGGMAAVGVAVAALGAAYVVFSRQLAEAEEVAAKAAKHAGALGKAHVDMESQLSSVAAELALVTGATDQYTLAQERRDTAIKKAAQSERQAAEAIKDARIEEIANARAKGDTVGWQQKVDRAMLQYQRTMSGVTRQEKDALQSSADIIEVQRERAESEEFLRNRAAARAKAQAAQAKTDAELLALEKERSAALKQLQQITASSSLAVLSGEARLTEELQRQLEQINRLENASEDAAAASASRQAVAIQYEQQIGDIRERKSKEAADAERRRIAETERARQVAMRQSLDLLTNVAGLMSSGWGRAHQIMLEDVTRLEDYQAESGEHLTKRQQRQLAKRIEDQKRAARNAFEVQQSAAAAQAAVQTALAVATALGSAPWPASLIPAAGALAAGVAQQQAIAKQRPSFHRGGGVDLAPDELTATVRRSEFVLNPTGRGMMGDGALHRANAGQSGGSGGQVVAVSVYKHTRQVDRWKRDGLFSGDPISRAIERGRLVGHRSNR